MVLFSVDLSYFLVSDHKKYHYKFIIRFNQLDIKLITSLIIKAIIKLVINSLKYQFKAISILDSSKHFLVKINKIKVKQGLNQLKYIKYCTDNYNIIYYNNLF